jgi:hypothetical protein
MLTIYYISRKKLFQQNILNMSEGIWENNFSVPLYPMFPYMSEEVDKRTSVIFETDKLKDEQNN